MSDEPDLIEVMKAVKRSPWWPLFREKILEFRLNHYQKSALVPASSQEQLFNSERMKGAALAIAGILDTFDTKLPEREGDENVEVSGSGGDGT